MPVYAVRLEKSLEENALLFFEWKVEVQLDVSG